MSSAAIKKIFIGFEVKHTVMMLAISIIIPFCIHVLPATGGIPMGARLLAFFYAPFIAAIFFRPHVAFITALSSPLLNSLCTGHPARELVGILTVELVLFCSIIFSLTKTGHFKTISVPFSLIASVVLTSLLLKIIPAFYPETSPAAFLVDTITRGLPGIFLLSSFNFFVVKSSNRAQ
jgi:hypothetical protein